MAEGLLLFIHCFHFLIVALVPKASKCLAASIDLSLLPSRFSKATARKEAKSAL